jgi:hypothetical protein
MVPAVDAHAHAAHAAESPGALHAWHCAVCALAVRKAETDEEQPVEIPRARSDARAGRARRIPDSRRRRSGVVGATIAERARREGF